MEHHSRPRQGAHTLLRSRPLSPPTHTHRTHKQTYRAVQYFSRFLAWYLLTKGHKLEAARWNALKNHLALGRKCACIPFTARSRTANNHSRSPQ